MVELKRGRNCRPTTDGDDEDQWRCSSFLRRVKTSTEVGGSAGAFPMTLINYADIHDVITEFRRPTDTYVRTSNTQTKQTTGIPTILTGLLCSL